MDLSSIAQSLQRGFGEVPPIAIALALLAGPTAALIGYRLISVARRLTATGEVQAEALWVCHDCRSVNELRVSRCYHCKLERDAAKEIEVIVDRPSSPSGPFEVPVGSPFAAAAAEARRSQGTPVMADAAPQAERVAVGPGRVEDATSADMLVEADSEPQSLVEADR